MAHTRANAVKSTLPRPNQVPGAKAGTVSSAPESWRKPATTGSPNPPALTKVSGVKLTGVNSNEMSQAVPSRILETRVTRRASHGSGTVQPSKLVNHARNFGAR